MKFVESQYKIPLFVGIGFLAILILGEFLGIMRINNGMLVYTLDDAYIHMALSENIMNGHYGINSNEYSAPSSTILWPFIIAPFASSEYFPLLLNIIIAIATIVVFVKILDVSFHVDEKRINNIFISSLVILLILVTNLVGLIFTGMEHSLQVFLVAVIAYGLILELEKNKVETWFLAAIVIAPLIRYENLAISIAAIGYLLMRKYFKNSATVVILLFVFLIGFSLFLKSLGLDMLPTSIAVKSSIVQSGGKLSSILENIRAALHKTPGLIMSLSLMFFLTCFMFMENIRKKQLALVTMFAILMHLIAGRYDWYHRYEIYIWSFEILMSLYLLSDIIRNAIKDSYANAVKVVIIAILFFGIAGKDYIYDLFTVPVASNNIYEQQYQMHRFVVDYYKKPVAVNDMGYVSYKNTNRVLDLWGLANVNALNYRLTRSDSNWMKQLTDDGNIGLVMIYNNWFKGIPGEWLKIGELHIGKEPISVARGEVLFYATNPGAYSDIVEKLQIFIKTLPSDERFVFQR